MCLGLTSLTLSVRSALPGGTLTAPLRSAEPSEALDSASFSRSLQACVHVQGSSCINYDSVTQNLRSIGGRAEGNDLHLSAHPALTLPALPIPAVSSIVQRDAHYIADRC